MIGLLWSRRLPELEDLPIVRKCLPLGLRRVRLPHHLLRIIPLLRKQLRLQRLHRCALQRRLMKSRRNRIELVLMR